MRAPNFPWSWWQALAAVPVKRKRRQLQTQAERRQIVSIYRAIDVRMPMHSIRWTALRLSGVAHVWGSVKSINMKDKQTRHSWTSEFQTLHKQHANRRAAGKKMWSLNTNWTAVCGKIIGGSICIEFIAFQMRNLQKTLETRIKQATSTRLYFNLLSSRPQDNFISTRLNCDLIN